MNNTDQAGTDFQIREELSMFDTEDLRKVLVYMRRRYRRYLKLLPDESKRDDIDGQNAISGALVGKSKGNAHR